MADEKSAFVTKLGEQIEMLTELIQVVEAVEVLLAEDVLAQGKGAQAPFDETPPEPTPEGPIGGGGRSGNSNPDQSSNHPQPNA